LIMSDYDDSTVTYTTVSSPYEDSSDMGSPGFEGPPMMPEDLHARYTQSTCHPRMMSYQLKSSHCLLLPHLLLRDDGDDEESSNDDDVEEDEEDEDEEEEEHLAPVDPAAVAFPVDLDPSDEETEPFETDVSTATPPSPPHPTYRVTARMSIQPQAPAPFLSKEDIERFLALPTPPLSPLSQYSSPLPQIPSPPLPIPSPPPNSPTYIEAPLGFKAAGIRQRDTSPSLVHETEIPEICLPLRKRPCRTAPTSRYEVEDSSAAGADRQDGPAIARVDLYGFVDMVDAALGRLMSSELGYSIMDTWDDLEDGIIDRPYHKRTTLLIEEEARVSCVAWAQSMDASDKARSEGMSLRTTVIAQQLEITELRAADRRRRATIIEMLAVDSLRQKQLIEALKLLKKLQAQMTEFQRQQGPANGPAQPEVPGEAGGSS
ncbi:hypothetical protein Tco_0885044, partial [Tanacetum coccineum]